jgi:TatA/E family protein of Tat protein translocase
MPSIGPMEMVLLLGLALLLFGAKRLPEIGRSLGQGMREFKSSVSTTSELASDDAPSGELAAAVAAVPADERDR